MVKTFRQGIDYYQSNDYKEDHVRKEFIDKFFKALGWDVYNENGVWPPFREVISEATVKDEKTGTQKEPDYAFGFGGNPVFYVEAKKPSVNLKENKDADKAAFQVRRYAHSASMPISILTDFEEFSIYDTSVAPRQGDTAKEYRIRYFTYDQYVQDKTFDFLWDTFSYDSVQKGSIDRFSKDKKNNRGTGQIDVKLLQSIEKWRLSLAKNLALRNDTLPVRNLNAIVQKIINRIVFLRIAEDKAMENYGSLKEAVSQKGIYQSLQTLFANANCKYNSGIFAQEAYEKHLTVDDVVLKNIIEEMYPPKCYYVWKVLPVDILGNIYEKLLGSTITFKNVKNGHTVTIEEKPEVKKAGGVYYTPRYIADYIIQNTLGEKLASLSLKEAEKITICDPACGSGSFLIRAYKYLMDWYLTQYLKDEQKIATYKKRGVIIDTANGGIELSMETKKRILLNHIYGVDLDAQAVEVTKLSLLLQMLENEGREFGSLFRSSDMHILPKLENNIKSGNSLIGTDFYNNCQSDSLDNDKMFKINAFDWEQNFPEIFDRGGFQVVVGNPPYINVQLVEDQIKEYYRKKYSFVYKRYDVFAIFLERTISHLLSPMGTSAFIVPSVVHSNLSYKKFRDHILNDRLLRKVCYTGNKVFIGPTIDTTILVFDKSGTDTITIEDMSDPTEIKSASVAADYFSKFDNLISVNTNSTEKQSTLFEKLFRDDLPEISEGYTVFQGIVTGKNPAYIFDSEQDAIEKGIEKELLHPLCLGRDVEKYDIKNSNRRILYLSNETNIENYPGARSWLLPFKDSLIKRREVKKGVIEWFSLQWPRKKAELDLRDKILMQRTRNESLKTRIVATLDSTAIYGMEGIIFVIPKADKDVKPLAFLLGILNSKLINYLFATKFLNLAIKAEYLKRVRLPLASQEVQNEISALVMNIIDAKRVFANALSDQDKKICQQKIDIFNQKIDEKVYKLYGLSDEEISMIEANS